MGCRNCGCNRGCECIPAAPGETIGQILVWNGTAWVVNTAPTTVGQTLVWNGTTWVPSAAQSANYGFGSVSIAASSTTFLYPWNAPTTSTSGTTLAIAGQVTALFTGVLRRFYVRHGNPSGANTMTYTLMLNGVATGVVLALASGSTLQSDLVSSVAVTTGDSLGVQVNNSGVLLGLRAQWDMLLQAA